MTKEDRMTKTLLNLVDDEFKRECMQDAIRHQRFWTRMSPLLRRSGGGLPLVFPRVIPVDTGEGG